MSNTYIIGHVKPDTDAVVAAIAFEYLYSQHECFGHTGAKAMIAEGLNPETSFLFQKFGVKTPAVLDATTLTADDTIVLVDHNESSQRPAGITDDHIVEIIDHHKINVNFNTPIFITTKPWGSTTTIAYFLMKQYDVTPDLTLASLMLAAILSDTVGFKSATTTKQDKKFGAELAELAQITDIDAFALEIFKAKSDISSLTPQQIVTNDYKVFDFGKRVLINQLETVEQEVVLSERSAELLEAMVAVKEEQNVDLIFVAVTDVLQVNTKLLLLSDAEEAVATAAFGGTIEPAHVLDIGPKMSRKKEIAPAIERALA